MKNDISKSITIEQLKQQYNLDNKKLSKAVEQEMSKLNKVENELNDYVNAVTKDIENLQDQVDGNITTWFFNGVPSLNNEPANEWLSDNEKNNHLGDLYYDGNTGYSYRFTLENGVYNWIKLTDSDITEALALANSAKDTADSKRRVFMSEPVPPYDNGDMWIKDNEIWICQISKPLGEIFESSDFINNLKYTDDTLASEVDGKLTIVSGKVTTIEQNVDKISQQVEENKYFVDSEGNKQLISSSMTEMTQEVNGLQIEVSQFNTNLGENYYTKENIDTFILNTQEGLTNTFTKIGGNNLLRNTGLYFKTNDVYDYWNGNVEKKILEESASGTSMLLKAGSLKQDLSLANGTYSVGFKYRRLNPLGNASIKYNGREIILDEEGEITTTGEITTNSFEIEIICNTDNSYEIWELMLNKGSESTVWSQSANEVHTDTVNISKGVTVEATENDTKATLGANGLNVVNKITNAKVLKATDTGIETTDIKATSGTISGLMLKKVGNQTIGVGI